MKTTIRRIGEANLLIAIMAALLYLVSAWAEKAPINQCFLGVGPVSLSRGGGSKEPPWMIVGTVELLVIVTFLTRKQAKLDLKSHRKVCRIIGLIGLYVAAVSLFLPDIEATHIDRFLAFYVWGSHVFYAFTGQKNLT